MRTAAVLLTSCAFLALPIGAAGAGSCTSEIDNLAKMLVAHDAGSGPTPGTGAEVAGQHPPTAAMSQADQGGAASAAAAQSSQPQHPPTAIMNRETTGSSSPGAAPEATKEEHPPTAAMDRATQGSAASPRDVQRQNQGQPTAAQQARGQISQSHDMAAAMAALERARVFDRHGNEAACLSAIGEAKLLAGSR